MFIVIAFLAHHGCSDLAESDTMSPARAFKHEAFGQPVALALLLHYKSGAVKVRRRQRAAYFEFLADDAGLLGADNLQAVKTARRATRHGYQVDDVAIVLAAALAHKTRQLDLVILHRPSVEVGGLLVVAVEHLREDMLVGGVAECGWRRKYPLSGIFLDRKVG